MLLSTDVSRRGEATVLTVTGEVDAYTVAALAPVMEQLPFGADLVLVIDLRPVTFLDSSGLSAIVATRRRVSETGGELRIVCDGLTRRLFELTSMDQVLNLYATLEEADPSAPAARGDDPDPLVGSR